MLRQTLQSRLRQDLDLTVAELYSSLLLQQFQFLEQRLARGASGMASDSCETGTRTRASANMVASPRAVFDHAVEQTDARGQHGGDRLCKYAVRPRHIEYRTWLLITQFLVIALA